MGDVDKGDPNFALDALQLDPHLLAQLQVERAEWLIKEQHRRLIDECARECNTLRLSAGELCWDALLVANELHQLHRLADASLQLIALDAGAAEAEGDVLVDREVREECVALEDGVDVALVGGEEGDINTL